MLKVLAVQAVPRVFKKSEWCIKVFFFLNLADTFINLFFPVNCCCLSCLITLCLNHINSLFLGYFQNIISCYTNLISQRKQTHKIHPEIEKQNIPHQTQKSPPHPQISRKTYIWERCRMGKFKTWLYKYDFRNSIEIH